MDISFADTPPSNEAFDRVTRLIRRIFGVDIAVVSLIDGQRQRFKSIVGFEATEIPLEDSFCRAIWRQGTPVLISNATVDPEFSTHPLVLGGPNIRSYVGVPLKTAEGEMIGTVCALHSEPRDFSQTDVLVLEDLAQIASAELDLREKASVDVLTGVMSRRSFLEESQRLLLFLHRKRLAMSVIIIDIDHFKSINDRFGHDAGDEVLKAVTQACSMNLRDYDLFGRLGGEEFGISLDGDAQQAMVIADRLRQAVEDLAIDIGGETIHVTASFGAAECKIRSETFNDAIKRADVALYEAKRAGRNRIICAENSLPILSGPLSLQ